MSRAGRQAETQNIADSLTQELTPPLQLDGAEDGAGPSASAPAKSAPTEPKKQSFWSQEMKENFGQLVDNLQDMVDLNRQLLYVKLT